jgi:hypothetical protein
MEVLRTPHWLRKPQTPASMPAISAAVKDWA